MNAQTVKQSVIRSTALLALLALAAFGLFGAPRLVDAQDAVFASGEAVVVNADSLNLRSDASASAGILLTLGDGAVATVVDGPVDADGYSWYQIDADGTTGWSAGDYLASASGDAAYLPAGTIVQVSTDALNLRADATTSADVTLTLASGDVATVISGPYDADGYSWYELDVDGVTGYAVRDFLAFATSDLTSSATTGSVVLVNTNGVSLRDDASLSGTVLGSLEGGATATVVSGPSEADGYTWYQVETDLGTGWVAGEFLWVV